MGHEIRMRDAAAQDAGAVTALHVASWRSAYRGVLPDAYLDGDVETERAEHWQKTLGALGPKDFVLLAEEGRALRGFISIYWHKEPGHDAYLDNLHVDPGHRGGGLGRQLLAAALQRLIEQGARSLCLWAFDQNEGAIRFYQRLGGSAVETGFDDFANANAPHTKIAWDDLPAFLRACEGANPS